MSEADMKKGRSLDRKCGPPGVENTAGLMEDCLLAPHCGRRHRPSACDKFKDLSLQHRQSVLAAKELCVRCLRHSDLDESKKKECIRRETPLHGFGSDVKRPDAPACQDRDLPLVEAKAGRSVYACRINIRVKTRSDSHKEAYSAELTTLFSATRQMSAISLSAAIEQGLPYRVVPEVNVMLGDGRREKSSRLFFLEIKPHRSTAPLRKVPEPYLVAAYGVGEAAPAAVAAPELPLLRERFGVRPTLIMGDLAQKAGPIDLVIARDYRQYWPRLTDSSHFASDDFHLMKLVLGQLLFGEAEPEAVGTMKKGVKRRLTQGTGESEGSSPSSSRRSRELILAADSPGKRRCDPPSLSREGERERRKVRSPSPRPTSVAALSARLQQETSTPGRRDETVKSAEKSKDESLVRRTPARKKRARKISSDNSSSSSSSSSDSSSSSEDEAMAEDKVIDRSEEEQLRVLKEKRAAHKRLKSRMRKKVVGSLIRKAKKFNATLRKSQETEKEAEKTEAEQQGEEAEKAESSEADLAVTERGERSGKERSTERIVREGTSRTGWANPLHRRLERPARRRWTVPRDCVSC
jgi:hypothetical protein